MLICYPNFIQQFHNLLINSKYKCYIKTYTTKSRYCALVKPESKIKHLNLQPSLAEIVQTRKFFFSVFSCIQNKYGHLLCKSLSTVQIWKNTDQTKHQIRTLFKLSILL